MIPDKVLLLEALSGIRPGGDKVVLLGIFDKDVLSADTHAYDSCITKCRKRQWRTTNSTE